MRMLYFYAKRNFKFVILQFTHPLATDQTLYICYFIIWEPTKRLHLSMIDVRRAHLFGARLPRTTPPALGAPRTCTRQVQVSSDLTQPAPSCWWLTRYFWSQSRLNFANLWSTSCAFDIWHSSSIFKLNNIGHTTRHNKRTRPHLLTWCWFV